MSRRIRPLLAEKSPQVKSEKPSSEIDLDEVLRLAREADEAAKDEPQKKPPKRRKEGVDGRAVEPDIVIPPDQEFVDMCKWGVGSAVDIARTKLDWSDPGIHWKEKVSVVLARLINRIQPMEPSWITDLTIIGGYTALWVIPNVSVQRATEDKGPVGNNGKREDSPNAQASAT